MRKEVCNHKMMWTKENSIQLLWSVLWIVCLLGIYLWMFLFILDLRKTFHGFGVDQTVATNFIFQYSYLYPVFYSTVILSFIAYFLYAAINGTKEGLFKKCVKINVGIAVIITLITLFFLYIPIFKLGSVV